MKSRSTTLSNKKVPKSKSSNSARKKSGVTSEKSDSSETAIAVKSVTTEKIRFSQRTRSKSTPSGCENKTICSQQFKNTYDNSAYSKILVIKSDGGKKSLPEATTQNDKQALKAKSSNSARKKSKVTSEKSDSSRASNKITKSTATEKIRILQRIRSTSVPSSCEKSADEKKTICSQEFKNTSETCDTVSCSTIIVNKSDEEKKSLLEATIPSNKKVLKAKSSKAARKKSEVTSEKSDSSRASNKITKSTATEKIRILQRIRSTSVPSSCEKSAHEKKTICSQEFKNASETCDTVSSPTIIVNKSDEEKKSLLEATIPSNKKVLKAKSSNAARKKSEVTSEKSDSSRASNKITKSTATEKIRILQRIRNTSVPSSCEKSAHEKKNICSQEFKNASETCDTVSNPTIIVNKSDEEKKSLLEATISSNKKVLKAKSSNAARKKSEVTSEKSDSSRASNKITKSTAIEKIRTLQRIRSTSVPSSCEKSVHEKKTICSQEFKNTSETYDTPSSPTIIVNKSEGKKSLLEATIPSNKKVLKAKSSNSARRKSEVTFKKSDSSETSNKMTKSVATEERSILQTLRTRSKSVFSNYDKSVNKKETICLQQFNNTSKTCDTPCPAIPVNKSDERKKYLPVPKTRSSFKRRLESPHQVPIPSNSDNVISGKEGNKKTLNAESPTSRSKDVKSSFVVGFPDYLKSINNFTISINETDIKIKGDGKDQFSHRVNCNSFPHKIQEFNSRNSPVNSSVACEEESKVLKEELCSPEKVDNNFPMLRQKKKSISSQHSLHLDNIFKCERQTSSSKTDKKLNKLEDNVFANNSIQTSAEESTLLLKKGKNHASVDLQCSLVPPVNFSKSDQDIKNYKRNVTQKSKDKRNQSSFIHDSLGDSSRVIGKQSGSSVKLQSELDHSNALRMLDQDIIVNTKNLTHKSDANVNQNSRKLNSLDKSIMLIERRKRSASEELKYKLHHYADKSDHDIRDDTKKVIFTSEIKRNWCPFIHDASSDSSTAIKSQRRSSIQVQSGLIHSVDIPMSDLKTEVNKKKLPSDAEANRASRKRGSLDGSSVLDKRGKKSPSAEPKCRLQQFVDTLNYDEINTKKRQPKNEDREQSAAQPRLFLKTCEDISVPKRNVKDSTPEKPKQFSENEHSFLSSDPHIMNEESNSTESEMSIEEHLVSHTPNEKSNSRKSDMFIEENLVSQNSIPPCQNSYGYISHPVLLPVQQTNSNLANKSFILANAIVPHPQINNQWVFPNENPLICQPQEAYPMQNYYVIAMPQLPITYPIYQTVPLLQQSDIQCNDSWNTDFGTLQPNNPNVAAQNANNAEEGFNTLNAVNFNCTTSGTTRKKVTKWQIFKQTSLACPQSARAAFNKPDESAIKNFNKKYGEILQKLRKTCLNGLENDGRKWFSHNPSQSQITVNQFYSNPIIFKVLGERICKMPTEMTIPSKFQYVFGDSFFESPIREIMKDYVDFHQRSLYRGPAYKDYFVKRAFKKLPFGSCLYLCEAFPEENEFFTRKDLICYLSAAALVAIFDECKKKKLL